MNVTDYTYLINSPNAVNEQQTVALEKIVAEFPFFQSARALRLKGLYNQDSFRYNYDLKITAAHTTDRSVLFDFITSDTFTAIHKNLYHEKVAEIHDILVVGSEVVFSEEKIIPKINPLEQSILTSIKEASPIAEQEIMIQKEESIVEITEDKLAIGKPLDFSKEEKHSFQEWLQLSKIQPIEREDTLLSDEKFSEIDLEKKKQMALIDKFIETSPKIPPVKQDALPKMVFEPSKEDKSYLMTETLARVYLEQKKYPKAIQAYEILILKYPEKITFFADRISDIKILQQNNK
ncbi:tetratricopeptide repeat protein [Flavobacterium sp.]|uniref:tetratricopeptide repeat protein n=1 Tax=Flavobacterium sp. TaxID=239 RepID=UPI002B4B164E|nr:tetratricopeptide repeat protein [Flavobacterium sp.]HLF52228.1 tetratricopeptide repeat protein [Flavobacterium sp.]